jgi:hypothetical protein
MITTEHQYRITKSQREKLSRAIERIEAETAAAESSSNALAKAEVAALKSEADVLSAQLRKYEALKSGDVRTRLRGL